MKFEIKALLKEDGTAVAEFRGNWVTPRVWAIVSDLMSNETDTSIHVKQRRLAGASMSGELHGVNHNWIVLHFANYVFVEDFIKTINEKLAPVIANYDFTIEVVPADFPACIEIMAEVGCYGQLTKIDDTTSKFIFAPEDNIECAMVLELLKTKGYLNAEPETEEPEVEEPITP